MMTSIQRRNGRRKFFFDSAAIGGWTVIAREMFADDAPRTIGLGFSLYGMKSLPISAALTALAEIGYDCVELPVMPEWPADSARISRDARREIRTVLAERGLRLTALMENLPALGDDEQHRANVERL